VLPRSRQAYLACVRHLAKHFHKAPEETTPEELRQYFLYLMRPELTQFRSTTPAGTNSPATVPLAKESGKIADWASYGMPVTGAKRVHVRLNHSDRKLFEQSA
jgi:hypothetical protein